MNVKKRKRRRKISDITKCNGFTCFRKADCLRYTCKADKYWQSWLAEDPRKPDGGCNLFVKRKKSREEVIEEIKAMDHERLKAESDKIIREVVEIAVRKRKDHFRDATKKVDTRLCQLEPDTTLSQEENNGC